MLHLLAMKPNNTMKNWITTFLFLLVSFQISSQKPTKLSSNEIYEKIQKLVTLIKELKTENEKLKSDIELSRDVQNRLKNDLEKLLVEKESNLNNLKFNTLAAENLTKEQIKAQIDQYISEIDNCIAQIEKL